MEDSRIAHVIVVICAAVLRRKKKRATTDERRERGAQTYRHAWCGGVWTVVRGQNYTRHDTREPEPDTTSDERANAYRYRNRLGV